MTKPLNTFTLWRRGREAVRNIRGIRTRIMKGFLLNLLIFMVLAVVSFFVLLRYMAFPIRDWLGGVESEWLAQTGYVSLWVVTFVLALVFLVFLSVSRSSV